MNELIELPLDEYVQAVNETLHAANVLKDSEKFCISVEDANANSDEKKISAWIEQNGSFQVKATDVFQDVKAAIEAIDNLAEAVVSEFQDRKELVEELS